MPEPAIFHLPQALRPYNATKPTHTPDDICPVCRRAFGARDDDDTNETEVPCEAMQLSACSHAVGSVCLKKLRVMGIKNCPFCVAPMELGPSPVHPFVRYLATSRWFREGTLLMLGQRDGLAERTARYGYGRYGRHELAQFVWLNQCVFAGVATGREALDLWRRYVELLLLSDLMMGFMTNFIVWIILSATTSFWSNRFYGSSSWAEFALAWVGLEIVFLIIKVVLGACSNEARTHFCRHEFGYHFSIFRTAVAVWSTTGAVLVEVLDNFLQATLIGILISYGVVNKNETWTAVSREISSKIK